MQNIRKVMLLIPQSRGFEQGLLRGIISYSNLHGSWMFWQKPHYYQETAPVALLEAIADFRPDGIIMRQQPTHDEVEQLSRSGIPTIFVPYDDSPSWTRLIQTNDCAIGQLAAEYLLDKGFRHFAYCGYGKLPWSVRRADGFAGYLAEKGYKVAFYHPPAESEPNDWQDRRRLLSNWLLELERPVAVLACNDDRGREVAEACRNSSIMVPDQIAILGVDNDELMCNLTSPALSSICLSTDKAGYNMARLLDEWMRTGQSPSDRAGVEPTKVVERQSTDVFQVDDTLVQQAIRYIQSHSAEPLQVEDCVRAMCVSRRTLQQRFQSTLGTTIHQQIRRARIERISRMLLESNLTVKQIALTMGYSSDKHISRVFKKEKGMGLVEYRRLLQIV